MGTNYNDQIHRLETKIEQLKAREKALKQRHPAEERKKRTRRLIELGGIVEAVLGRPTTDEDKKRFMEFLQKQERNGKFFSRAMNDAATVNFELVDSEPKH